MEFWTANTLFGPATLCDRCALLAVNLAAMGHVRRPYGTMAEAVADIDQRCAAADVDLLDIHRSPTGVCGNCGEDQVEAVSA